MEGNKRFGKEKTRSTPYDRDWQNYRLRFLARNPDCYCCGKKSQVVDHIKPHKGDDTLFKSETNHMPLCTRCHNIITASFDRHEEPKLEDKLNWINMMRVNNMVSVKVRPVPYTKQRKFR